MPHIPLELVLPLPLFTGYIALYRLVAPKLQTEKQRAYILSVATSFSMTVLSAPFATSYLLHGLGHTYEQAQYGWRAELVRFGTVLFGVYLVADVSPSQFAEVAEGSRR
jgi:hypothetical protein